MAIIDTIRQALTLFTDELQGLRKQIETLQREREGLLAQPAARSDVIALLQAWCDAEREAFVKALRQRLRGCIEAPKLGAEAAAARLHRGPQAGHAFTRLGSPPHREQLPRAGGQQRQRRPGVLG